MADQALVYRLDTIIALLAMILTVAIVALFTILPLHLWVLTVIAVSLIGHVTLKSYQNGTAGALVANQP